MSRDKLRVILFILCSSSALCGQAGDYSVADKCALSTPADAEASTEKLAAYFKTHAQSELTRARAIYRWIAHNVRYDPLCGTQTPDGVLKGRRALCDGYSQLYYQVAMLSGLQCEYVTGYSKGYGYVPGNPVTNSMHAWNAVCVDGNWHLLDVTWGAGYLNEKREFVRDFNDAYFLTPPEEFILTHFPRDRNWQLLKQPVLIEDFEDYVYLFPAFLQLHLGIDSHAQARISTPSPLRVRLRGGQQAALVATIEQGGKRLEDSYTFVQGRNGRIDVHAVFPAAGEYVLKLFGKRRDEKELRPLLQYLVSATSGGGDTIGFPTVYRQFLDEGGYLFTPLDRFLKAGVPRQFRVAMPGATSIVVGGTDGWTVLTRRQGVFEGEVPVPKGEIRVAAQLPNPKGYVTLLKYSGCE